MTKNELHERLKMFKDDSNALDDLFEKMTLNEWNFFFELVKEEEIKLKNNDSL